MTLPLEHLPCPDSPLQRLDARWRLAALLMAAAAVTALQTLPCAAAVLLGCIGLTALACVPWDWFLRRLGAVALVFVFFTAVLPMALDGGPTLELGPVRLSWAGLRLALLICTKALAILTLMLVLLTTAPLPTTLKAAHALHVPALVIQLVVMTYRYVFVLGDELARLRVALRVRGFRNRADRHSYRTIGRVSGTLLVRGYERAERVSQAMRCRGFDGRFRSLAEFRTSMVDVAFFVFLSSFAVAALLIDFGLG